MRDLSALMELVGGEPGSSAVVMFSRGGERVGHVQALYSTAGEGLRWVDPQRSGNKVFPAGEKDEAGLEKDFPAGVAMSAVVLDPHGRVVSPEVWSSTKIPVHEALTDAPLNHQFGAHAEEVEFYAVGFGRGNGTSLIVKSHVATSVDGFVKVSTDLRLVFVDDDGKRYADPPPGVDPDEVGSWKLILVPEIVTVPGRTLDDDVTQDLRAAVEARRSDLIGRLQQAASSGHEVLLSDALGDEYRVQDEFRDTRVSGYPARVPEAPMHFQFTEDVPLAGIHAFLVNLAEHSRPGSGLDDLRKGIQFGRKVAAIVVAHLKVRGDFDFGRSDAAALAGEDLETLLDPTARAVMGVMALAYVMDSGYVTKHTTDDDRKVTKDYMWVVPRIPMRGLAEALGSDVQEVLEQHENDIHELFESDFRSDHPDFPNDAPLREMELDPNDTSGTRVGFVLDSVLNSRRPLPEGHRDELRRFGITRVGSRPTPRGNGALPVVPLEARNPGAPRYDHPVLGFYSDHQMLQAAANHFVETARNIDRDAAVVHAVHSDPLGRAVIDALTDRVIGQHHNDINPLRTAISHYLVENPRMTTALKRLLTPASGRIGVELVPWDAAIGFAEEAQAPLTREQEEQIKEFAAVVVNEAQRRQTDGGRSLVVHIEGGGNGRPLNRSRAVHVGQTRADITWEMLQEEVRTLLDERELPRDIVEFPDAKSRGREVPEGVVTSFDRKTDAAARRLVVVRLEDGRDLRAESESGEYSDAAPDERGVDESVWWDSDSDSNDDTESSQFDPSRMVRHRTSSAVTAPPEGQLPQGIAGTSGSRRPDVAADSDDLYHSRDEYPDDRVEDRSVGNTVSRPGVEVHPPSPQPSETNLPDGLDSDIEHNSDFVVADTPLSRPSSEVDIPFTIDSGGVGDADTASLDQSSVRSASIPQAETQQGEAGSGLVGLLTDEPSAEGPRRGGDHGNPSLAGHQQDSSASQADQPPQAPSSEHGDEARSEPSQIGISAKAEAKQRDEEQRSEGELRARVAELEALPGPSRLTDQWPTDARRDRADWQRRNAMAPRQAPSDVERDDTEAHIRRAVDAVLRGRDAEELTRPVHVGDVAGSGVAAARRGPNPVGLVVALGKATTAYKDVSQHDDAEFIHLLREQLTDPESGKTVLESLLEALDDLKALAIAHPRRSLTESQQTAYRVLRNSAGSIIDKALGSVQALNRDESLGNQALHFAGTTIPLAAPYAVPILHKPPSLNFISLVAAAETRAVLRMGGMARHSAYSGRLLGTTLFDLVIPWSLPGLTYLLPTVVPSLAAEQTDPFWALGSGLVQSAIIFGAGFPKLIPYLADSAISLGTAIGLPLPLTERRALANGELRLLSRSDTPPDVDEEALESQPNYLTQEELTLAISKVRSHLTTIETAKRMFEERGGHISDNTDRQISFIRSDISHLAHLGAQLVDAPQEGSAMPGRENVDFWPKLGYTAVTVLVRGTAAGASLTDPLSASDVLPATAYLIARSILELRDPNVNERDAANTFNNFTPPGLVAIVPNVANLASHGGIFDSAKSAWPWIVYLIGANATWGNWVGQQLSGFVSYAILAGQRHLPTVRDTVQSWFSTHGVSEGASWRPTSSPSDAGKPPEAMSAAGVPGGFSPGTGQPPDSQAGEGTSERRPASPGATVVRTDPVVAPEDAGPPRVATPVQPDPPRTPPSVGGAGHGLPIDKPSRIAPAAEDPAHRGQLTSAEDTPGTPPQQVSAGEASAYLSAERDGDTRTAPLYLGVSEKTVSTHSEVLAPESISSAGDTEDDVADHPARADGEPDSRTSENRFMTTRPSTPPQRLPAEPPRAGSEPSAMGSRQLASNPTGQDTTRRVRFTTPRGTDENSPDLRAARGSGDHSLSDTRGDAPQAEHPHQRPSTKIPPPAAETPGLSTTRRAPSAGPSRNAADQGFTRSRPNWLMPARGGREAGPGVSFLNMSESRGPEVMGRDVPGFRSERMVDSHTLSLAHVALHERTSDRDPAPHRRTGLVDANEIRHPLADAGRGAATARKNARWWKGLSEEQRRAVIAAYPEQVGNAEGLPPRVRDEANRGVFKDTLAREAANRYRAFKPINRLYAANRALRRAANRLSRIGAEEPLVLAFDPAAYHRDGRILVAVGGDPYTASSVSWMVPGLTTTIASLDGLLNDAVNLVESGRAEGAADAVVIVWIGYHAPSGWRSGRVLTQTAAGQGGEILHADITAFNAGRDATADDGTHFSSNHVFGHSYGSTTTAYAGRDGRLANEIQTVTLVGSPGAGPLQHADDFGIGPNVFVAGSSRDPVTALGRTPDPNGLIGQGIDPTLEVFGARRLASEFPRSMDTVASAATHISYYHYVDEMGPRSKSLMNFGRIVAGHQDRLELHDHRVDAQSRLGIPRTVDPAADRSASRRWWDPIWAQPSDRPQEPAAEAHALSRPPEAAEPSAAPQLIFGETAKKLTGPQIETVHGFASDIVDQAAQRYRADASGSTLVVQVEVGANGRRWPLNGWPHTGRPRAIGWSRAVETRNVLEAEVRRLLDGRNIPQSTVTFEAVSRGRGLPDSDGRAHDLESDEMARRVVTIRIGEAASTDQPLRVDLAETGASLGSRGITGHQQNSVTSNVSEPPRTPSSQQGDEASRWFSHSDLSAQGSQGLPTRSGSPVEGAAPRHRDSPGGTERPGAEALSSVSDIAIAGPHPTAPEPVELDVGAGLSTGGQVGPSESVPNWSATARSGTEAAGGGRVRVPGDGWCLLSSVVVGFGPQQWPAGWSVGGDAYGAHAAILAQAAGGSLSAPGPGRDALKRAREGLHRQVLDFVVGGGRGGVPSDVARVFHGLGSPARLPDGEAALRDRLRELGLSDDHLVENENWLPGDQLRGRYVDERLLQLTAAGERSGPSMDFEEAFVRAWAEVGGYEG
ncbi:alpha/beta hydrolase, partial [Mycobacterium sp. ACS1612]|uniref:alpha/beta hydrolase n=1 Tax=Mycobacterium sp. ACS1612 TaxID=1834117 RepID=UPI001E5E8A25